MVVHPRIKAPQPYLSSCIISSFPACNTRMHSWSKDYTWYASSLSLSLLTKHNKLPVVHYWITSCNFILRSSLNHFSAPQHSSLGPPLTNGLFRASDHKGIEIFHDPFTVVFIYPFSALLFANLSCSVLMHIICTIRLVGLELCFAGKSD